MSAICSHGHYGIECEKCRAKNRELYEEIDELELKLEEAEKPIELAVAKRYYRFLGGA